jgi:hypothetical protein
MRQFAIIVLIAGLPIFAGAVQQPIFSDCHKPSISQTFFESILREDSLQIQLVTDFKVLRKARNTKDYQPAELHYTDNKGTYTELDVEVRPRGKMRRRLCDVPPLKIRLPGDREGSRTLKMVSLCQNTRQYEQYLLREFFAYKLYNMLTDVSFRVQLAKVKFVDSNGRSAPMESFAILLENEKDLARRVHGFELSSGVAEPERLRSAEVELFCLFQYMIGNTDWFTVTGHNLMILGLEGKERPVLVPYDFDYSGLVNSPYATPDKRLKLPDVTARYYQGMKRDEAATSQSIQYFLSKKQEVMDYCESFPYFDKRSRNHVRKYLEGFFETLEQPKKWKREICQHSDLWIKL